MTFKVKKCSLNLVEVRVRLVKASVKGNLREIANVSVWLNVCAGVNICVRIRINVSVWVKVRVMVNQRQR
jgi:hypothetical protein